ncbi:efflux RND transporter periplasmic adaptor subunit [Ferrimonas kyonanensis]|uniref:efflux RND transporter periplasmic adaptor subunit n=1 Tax=Ferrimonas kyonanensis TaxID=364763 RepID=UPI000486F672|nr:efflux RND transporter periplasmic adaptor subunit [Ferrimonas kyonanensis]
MIRDTSQQDVCRQPVRRRWRAPVAALVLLSAIGAVTWLGLSSADKVVRAARLQTAQVERGNLIREAAARGRIIAANAPVVYATSAGLVKLLVQAGDLVTEQQPLLIIDSPALKSQLAQAQAKMDSLELEQQRKQLDSRRQQLELKRRLDQAKVTLDAADRERRRAEEAIAHSLISRIDYEQARDEFASAQLNYAHAGEEVALARDTLAFEDQTLALQLTQHRLSLTELQRQVARLTVRAPIDGMVGNTLVEDRDRIGANQPLLSVVSLSEHQAELEVPESYADDLGLAMPVQVEVAGLSLSGRIGGISPEISNNQVRVRVRFNDLGQHSTRLRQNQRLTARIQLQNLEDVLTVRRGAFVQSGGGRLGYRLKDGLARRTPLVLGASSLTHIQIVDGAHAGDTLIISDLSPLLDSSEIMVK